MPRHNHPKKRKTRIHTPKNGPRKETYQTDDQEAYEYGF